MILKVLKRKPKKFWIKLIVPGIDGYIYTTYATNEEIENIKNDTGIPDNSTLIISTGGF